MRTDRIGQQPWTRPHHRLRALFRRQDLESELEEELEQFIRLRADQLIADGSTPARARAEAVRAFDGIEQVKEECRDARGVRPLEEFWQDITFAFRTLRKTPVFAVGAVALLALALAANVIAASLLSALFFTPLPYPSADRLVSLTQELTTLRADGSFTPRLWFHSRLSAVRRRTFRLRSKINPILLDIWRSMNLRRQKCICRTSN